MAGRIEIGVLVDSAWREDRGLLQGISEFAQHRWQWHLVPDFGAWKAWGSPAYLRRFDGLIGRARTESIEQAMRAVDVPAISVSTVRLPRLPLVSLDNRDIGRLAADHLVDRGYRRFAFLGNLRPVYANQRFEGFVARLSELEYEYHPSPSVPGDHLRRSNTRVPAGVLRWIAELSAPVGIFAANDVAGWLITDACHACGKRVPEDIGVLGVDNDEMLCELARPTMSSIETGPQRTGRRAAQMLETMLAGDKVDPGPHLLPPVGVVQRQSTDRLAIADTVVCDALRFVERHAGEPIRVGDVARAVAVSRSTLERRFRTERGHSVAEEIRQVRLQKAMRCLTETDLPLAAVAHDCGYSSQQQMNAQFRRRLDTTPRRYRAQRR